jgi:hypothetical protein
VVLVVETVETEAVLFLAQTEPLIKVTRVGITQEPLTATKCLLAVVAREALDLITAVELLAREVPE